MNRSFKVITALLFLPFLLLTFLTPPLAHAADIRTGDEIRLVDKTQTLTNPYIFGGNIQIDSPVANELTTAGGDIVINGPIEESAQIAGGDITLRGAVGNNARIAGGNITIDGPIANDLVITGGSITLTRNASIGGDLLFAGGKLTVDGPIAGKALINGGEVTLNNSIGGDVSGEIGELKLGDTASIGGNLSYTSRQKAQIAQGAAVTGKTDYKPTKSNQEEKARGFATSFAMYKLIADILISLLLIYFFRSALRTLVNRIRTTPVKSGAIGFGFFILVPIAALVLLLLLWLGVAIYLLYVLLLLAAFFIGQIFIGWGILRWWNHSQKRDYQLDWKAAIIGPVSMFMLSLIPIFGWLVICIIFFIALGALVEEVINLVSSQSTHHAPTKTIASKRK